MTNKFSRSEFMKQRHAFAKEQRQFYEKKYGEEIKYSDFLKTETPLTRRLVTFEVSFQLSYRGESDHLNINPQTFKVTAFEGEESEIYNRTMSMILDSRGINTGSHFQPNTIEMMENNVDIQIKPRGMEESQKRPNRDEVKGVINSGFEVRELDNTINFTNKKGKSGQMRVDMRHFL